MNEFYLKLMLEIFTKIINKCLDCLKLRSNKNELDCKKCGCNEFYVPNY